MFDRLSYNLLQRSNRSRIFWSFSHTLERFGARGAPRAPCPLKPGCGWCPPSLRPRGEPAGAKGRAVALRGPVLSGEALKWGRKDIEMKSNRLRTQSTGHQEPEGNRSKKHPPRAQLLKLVLEAIKLLAPILKVIAIIHDAMKG